MACNDFTHNLSQNPGFHSIIIIIASLMLVSCNPTAHLVKETSNKAITIDTPDQYQDSVLGVAKIVFDSTTYHFGEIRQGDKLYREIYFTNMGPGNLKIELISACECTTLDWTRLPVKPGERSKIKLTYNSKDKSGQQIVDIEVTANTDPPTSYAKFKLYVLP